MNIEDYVVIDIETMPNPNMIDRLPEPTVKYGNTKDPAKRAIKEMEAKEKQIEKMALSSLFGKIACCAYRKSDSDKGVLFGGDIEGNKFSEKELVQKIVNKFFIPTTTSNPQICTHNGFKFDIPFIYVRALILGIEVSYPLSYWTKRYDISTHIDTRLIFNGWDLSAAAMTDQNTSLDVLGNVLLGYGKKDFDVTLIPEKIKTKEGRLELASYNMRDVDVTWGLLQKINNFLM